MVPWLFRNTLVNRIKVQLESRLGWWWLYWNYWSGFRWVMMMRLRRVEVMMMMVVVMVMVMMRYGIA